MNVLLVSILLWITALTLLARTVYVCFAERARTPLRLAVWLLLGLVSALLFFRPHEDIFGGQDTGAYLHTGTAIAREGRLAYVDPMLSRLPMAERSPFMIAKHYVAKYHSMWLPDVDGAVMAPWFQPALPLMLSLVSRLAGPLATLYVGPFFGLCCALAVACLAGRILKHGWAAELAYGFYVLIPLVIWHVRFPRPEVVASFLLLGGLALLLRAWSRPPWRGSPGLKLPADASCPYVPTQAGGFADLLLGSVCVLLAPFFHVISWMVVLPIAALAAVAVVWGRRDFFIYMVVAAVAGSAFAWQVLCVTDTYNLKRFVAPLVAHWPWFVTLGLSGLLTLGRLSVIVGRYRQRPPLREREEDGRRAVGLVLAGVVVALYLGVYVVGKRTGAGAVGGSGAHYIYPTDLRCVLNMISRPIGLLGLLGLALLCGWHRGRTAERLAVVVALAPASLLIGNMYDFFTTRYMLVALLPLLSVGLCSLVAAVPAGGRRWIGVVVAAAVVAGLGLRERVHLVTQTNYAGMASAIRDVADDIREQDGILLCEYSRIAAAFDLFFGVPTLGIDNERCLDYRGAEKAWSGIMAEEPARPAFLVTPFERVPSSDRFHVVPVGTHEYLGARLLGRGWELPRDVVPWGVGLHVYRTMPMAEAPPSPRFPWHLTFGDGNMGLRGFRRSELAGRAQVALLPVGDGTAHSLPLRECPDLSRDDELWMIGFSAAQPDAVVDVEGSAVEVRWEQVFDDWWLGRIGGMPEGVGLFNFTVQSDARLGIAAVRLVRGTDTLPLFDAWEQDGAQKEIPRSFTCRWGDQRGEFLAPGTGTGRLRLLAFLVVPEELGATATLTFKNRDAAPKDVRRMLTGQFMWEVWTLADAGPAGSMQHVSFRADPVDPSIDPDICDGLALALGHVVIVP